jgi:FKBP-type peptidyl-prolyl cis-trans isomerase FkpA
MQRVMMGILAALSLVVLPVLACSGGDDAGSGGGEETTTVSGGGEETTTVSGLEITHTTVGSGASPKPTDTVQVHYHGTFPDGTVFDSSVDRGEPASFPLNRVIRCWTEGVQQMKVGGKAKLVCPPGIAYGARGAPPRIPANATLHFDVELLAIQ